ncbi:uncharacterized protein LOC131439136 [Malaya genurostris]|uniref:uncharacterized protein LOC131439136 n=1 Tax=Malaya genurostris TaxID=325434 RepID=UPI0026F40761|nr:uncharacterized protein LOC131439136 [Malaya genurostris]
MFSTQTVMKLALVVSLLVGSVPTLCRAAQCRAEKAILYGINDLLNEEIIHHNMRSSHTNFIDKLEFVLQQLNNRISRQSGSAGCKSLENEIIESSKRYSVTVEGLESGQMRLRKLLDHLDARNNLQQQEINNHSYLQSVCETDKNDIQETFNQMNKTFIDLEKKFDNQTAEVTRLKDENRKLQAKVNKNSAAVHGETGVISGTDEIVTEATTEGTAVSPGSFNNTTPLIDTRAGETD